MKAWLANLFWDALLIFCRRAHAWAFDPERHARIRFAHRERWWSYRCKAMATKDSKDDMRAEAWRIQFDFKTPPEEAVARGDLDASARKIAMDAVERTRSRMSGERQP